MTAPVSVALPYRREPLGGGRKSARALISCSLGLGASPQL